MTPPTYIMLSFYQLLGHSLSFMDDFGTGVADSFSTTLPAIIVGHTKTHEDDPVNTLASYFLDLPGFSELWLHSPGHSFPRLCHTNY